MSYPGPPPSAKADRATKDAWAIKNQQYMIANANKYGGHPNDCHNTIEALKGAPGNDIFDFGEDNKSAEGEAVDGRNFKNTAVPSSEKYGVPDDSVFNTIEALKGAPGNDIFAFNEDEDSMDADPNGEREADDGRNSKNTAVPSSGKYRVPDDSVFNTIEALKGAPGNDIFAFNDDEDSMDADQNGEGEGMRNEEGEKSMEGMGSIDQEQNEASLEPGEIAESSGAAAAQQSVSYSETGATPSSLHGLNAGSTLAFRPPEIPPLNVSDKYTCLPWPKWYIDAGMNRREMSYLGKRPSPGENQAMKNLEAMKTCMDRCEKITNSQELEGLFNDLRVHVHKAEIMLKVDRFIVRKKQMLHDKAGLPRIFVESEVNYPWDLKEDAWQLYYRWHSAIFKVDLLRGIVARKGLNRNADAIDPSWSGRFSAKFNGEGHLVPGQWWPTQLTAVRDGAHGSAQGGIFGEKDNGCYSIVMSGAGNTQYEDEDNGNEVWYSGTNGKDSKTTECTLRMIESCDRVHKPIRVLRSHQLPKKNLYRPVVGLRYDGLYTIKEKKLVDQEKQIYKFRLVREPGQHPIRYLRDGTGRPTQQEIDADRELRNNGR